MKECVFEIFSEEIPATLQKKLSESYKNFVEQSIKQENIKYDSLAIGITINRFVVKIKNTNISQENLTNLVNKILLEFVHHFPRTMLYPQSTLKWIRPIRNIFLSNEFIFNCINR